METKSLYNALVQSLRLVASPFEIQIASLPEFVNVPDEIALLYNDAYLTVLQIQEEKLITNNTLVMLKELDEIFDEMSENKLLWTLEKLKDDKFWKKTRELALVILKELKEPYKKPNLNFIKWIR